MSEYTDGPWHLNTTTINGEPVGWEVVGREKGSANPIIVGMLKTGVGENLSHNIGDANLIASAPDMLEALEATNKELESVILQLNAFLKMNVCSSDLDEPDYHDMQTCHENQLLIAKAKGESK